MNVKDYILFSCPELCDAHYLGMISSTEFIGGLLDYFEHEVRDEKTANYIYNNIRKVIVWFS